MKERRSPVVVGLSKKPKVVRWSSKSWKERWCVNLMSGGSC